MIVRMKEIALFTLSSSMDETVFRLGELGVVDIREVISPESEVVHLRMDEVAKTEKAIALLEQNGKRSTKGPSENKYQFHDPRRLTNRLLASLEIKQQCLDKLENLRNQWDWYQTWGENVNPKDLDFLRSKGVFIRLYQVKRSALSTLGEDQTLVSFPERNGKISVALITTDSAHKLGLQEEEVPRMPFEVVKQALVRKERQLEQIEQYWSDQAEHLDALRDYQMMLQDRLDIQQVLEGMGDIKGTIKYLRGFIPTEDIDAFKAVAEEEKWGFQIREPEQPEEVPVYIRNPKWIRIIDPVMNFIGIVPGYKELDVSIFFLIAFALFFAMLVGDAGYGAVFLLLTLLFRKKLPSEVRLLFYVLSGATIVWGVLSGTYFGAEEIAALPFLRDLVVDEIASFGVDNISFMMHLSFLIGAIHLTVAHGIQVFRMLNSTKALSEIGWIALVWGLFFVVEKLVLGADLPAWNTWLFVAGALLVTLFSQESKNLGQSMLISIANLPLSLINGFSDIVSYVRLFAVGLATAAVAASFNKMLLPPGADLSFLELILAGLALALGHGLNIALALMAVMVHGIRLNMLEFAGHLGVQFSGEVYNPFKLKALPQGRKPAEGRQELAVQRKTETNEHT